MKRLIYLTASLLLFASLGFAITIHIPGDYPTIQQGIEAAVDGDTVLVEQGGYPEYIDFLGKEIVVKSESGPEVTSITWDGQDDVVTFDSGEGSGAVIEGFTIQNDYPGENAGMGILCGPGTAPVIQNNIIQDCGAFWSFGGGISATQSSPLIENNQITGNEVAYTGAGIFLHDCTDAIVRSNLIAGNYVWSGYGVSHGGGICCYNGSALIERNLIVNNISDPDYGYGGGFAIYYADSGRYVLSHNTFVNNVARLGTQPSGGGVFLQGDGSVEFCDNIVVSSPDGGGIAFWWGSVQLNVDFNDIWNNLPINYFRLTPGPGDICADPLFVGGSPFSYELTEDSPCIDAGSFTCEPDPDGTRSDMGAFHFDQAGMHVAIVSDSWPIIIPAEGGSFGYTLHVTNHTSSPSQFDLWVDALMLDSTVIGPIILRQNLMFAPQAHQERHVTQSVPGGAPEGDYLYMAHIGDYSTAEIIHETLMPFTKHGAGGGGALWTISPQLEDWGNVGMAQTDQPIPSLQLEAHPNPFNPVSTLTFRLPTSGKVRLSIYDVSGRTLATLLDREMSAGHHSVSFDATSLPSGIHISVLEWKGRRTVERLVLMK